jgi:hypothetical protein
MLIMRVVVPWTSSSIACGTAGGRATVHGSVVFVDFAGCKMATASWHVS